MDRDWPWRRCIVSCAAIRGAPVWLSWRRWYLALLANWVRVYVVIEGTAPPTCATT